MSSSRRTVLVVDDAALIRRVVCETIAATDDLEVIGEAADGLEAIAKVHALGPDLVTLDLDMPAMGGLDALGYIMSECPRPVIVLSGHEPATGGDVTMRALELGAVDFVRKPSRAAALDVETLRRRLVQALREAGAGQVAPLVPTVPPRRDWRRTPPRPSGPPAATTHEPATALVAIAASTGGPKALAELLPMLPVTGTALLVVQHMPAGFTASFARRLDELGPRHVAEARDDEPILAGQVYVAPGGFHLGVASSEGGPRCRLLHSPSRHGVRPSADVTFQGVAAMFGPRGAAVILTGMGRDGAAGARCIRDAGGLVLVQDPRTCVVSGMAQAAIAAGVAGAVLGLAELPAALARLDVAWAR